MKKVTGLIRKVGEFDAYLSCLRELVLSPQPMPIAVNGLSGGAEWAFLTESVREICAQGPTLCLVCDEGERERLTRELNLGGIRARGFKLREPVYYNLAASHEVDRERLSVLADVLEGKLDCVVATAAAAFSLTMPKDTLSELTLSFSLGDELGPDALTKKLSSLGFNYADAVEGKGQYAKRGGIVDFWCEDYESPVRVEFFGDEIDRITYFDPLTQRSEESLREVRILPARELIFDGGAKTRVLSAIDKLIAAAKLEDSRAKLCRERDAVSSDLILEAADKYARVVYQRAQTLFDYLFERPVFVMGTNKVRESFLAVRDRYSEQLSSLEGLGLAKSSLGDYFFTPSEFDRVMRCRAVHINSFAGGSFGSTLSGLFGFRTRRTVSYAENPALLFEDLLALKKSGYRTLLLSPTKSGAAGVVNSLAEYKVDAVPVYERESFSLLDGVPGGIYVGVGDAPGFELIEPKLSVISLSGEDKRSENRRKRQNRIITRRGGAERILSYAELTVGDYVVHANYGIGLFEGIEAVTQDGVTRDYITIRYAGTDKLFVPCNRIEMIGKYIGAKDKDGKVKLSVMGGAEWNRAKSRAKGAAKEIAKELIALYAERQRRPGFAFPDGGELEEEFDGSFEYEETTSQLRAINEIKADMMRPTPMNRLLCGDVGFGKTEVAIRAAFKAVLGGKQVAILVPTTILAMQHFQTVKSRLRSYPISVEMLSRFRTQREKEKILDGLKRGRIDVVIGTHALLSKNVEFSDLGLFIVDEEQRFGVMQKERLRELAKNVDTLMLSATPIPRTLNMAMSGISDISVLDEAPGERRPVQTYVLEHDDGIITDALRREIDRGGQVLYLYNKIDDIFVVADRIMRAIPEARVAYAHGAMDKDELEDIWSALVSGEIDILVCTTIIETGVDLPRANTLVIENADRFGLSQLHQIRGRVGRSERQAYAYFTYRPGKALSEIAETRLRAIKEYAEFGAGFRIAMCDLEIRGAGNLLGAEQHGHIESVGYDLYVKLLNEAVLSEKGELSEKPRESEIAINISAHIPESYIPTLAERMGMYKKILVIENAEDYSDVLDEFSDRFGQVPREVMRLLDVALAKALATEGGIKRIEEKGGRLYFYSEKPDLARWSEVFEKFKGASFLGASCPTVVYRLRAGEDPTSVAKDIMKCYQDAK